MSKILLSLSGGMDSATLLAWCLDKGHEVEVVGFNYGSKHNIYERAAAVKLIDHYGVKEHYIDLALAMNGFKSNLLTSGGPIPEGHYNDATMSQTVVPCRNMIFLSIIAGLAESLGASKIAIGAHSGDHAIYPDCRPEFLDLMSLAVLAATDGKVEVITPFKCWNKKSILEWGTLENVPYEKTRTCYKDQPDSCGKCGSCVERLEAWEFVGAIDPIQYQKDEI